MLVHVGSHDKNKFEGTEQTVRIKEIIKHPLYKRIQKGKHKIPDNDFAIIKLAKPVIFNKYVNPICLPLYNDKKYESVEARFSGWGSMYYEQSAHDKLHIYTKLRKVGYHCALHSQKLKYIEYLCLGCCAYYAQCKVC